MCMPIAFQEELTWQWPLIQQASSYVKLLATDIRRRCGSALPRADEARICADIIRISK